MGGIGVFVSICTVDSCPVSRMHEQAPQQHVTWEHLLLYNNFAINPATATDDPTITINTDSANILYNMYVLYKSMLRDFYKAIEERILRILSRIIGF